MHFCWFFRIYVVRLVIYISLYLLKKSDHLHDCKLRAILSHGVNTSRISKFWKYLPNLKGVQPSTWQFFDRDLFGTLKWPPTIGNKKVTAWILWCTARAPSFTPWKFNSSPLKISHPKRKGSSSFPIIFQGRTVKLRGCNVFFAPIQKSCFISRWSRSFLDAASFRQGDFSSTFGGGLVCLATEVLVEVSIS